MTPSTLMATSSQTLEALGDLVPRRDRGRSQSSRQVAQRHAVDKQPVRVDGLGGEEKQFVCGRVTHARFDIATGEESRDGHTFSVEFIYDGDNVYLGVCRVSEPFRPFPEERLHRAPGDEP